MVHACPFLKDKIDFSRIASSQGLLVVWLLPNLLAVDDAVTDSKLLIVAEDNRSSFLFKSFFFKKVI